MASLLATSSRHTLVAAPSAVAAAALGAVRCSHIGRAPIVVPPGTSIKELPFAPHPNPLSPQPPGLRFTRSLLVEGQKGRMLVPLHQYVLLNRKEVVVKAAEGEEEGKQAKPDANAPKQQLALIKPRNNVKNVNPKKQRGIWGLTRALLANAVEGVEKGHKMTLKMVGVGYRAALEVNPFPRPDKLAIALDENAEVRTFFSSPAQKAAYKELYSIEAGKEPTPMRLNIRLGYSHPVLMPIPRGITATVPQPTVIELYGVNKAELGQFAASIRAWRKPEPYKGKGIFVNGETIRLRTAKKK